LNFEKNVKQFFNRSMTKVARWLTPTHPMTNVVG